MKEQLSLLPQYLTAHLQLTLTALLLGTVVSVPLGILVTRRKRLEQLVLGVVGVIQTIPSLALLAIVVPTLAALSAWTRRALGFEIQSIGYVPALIGLTLYSMLPILRNTVVGIRGVDPALVEAARGVGMTPAQQLRQVELPLAMPVVVAGLRTSIVWVVGIATLSTPVGAPSLGNFIFSGLQTRNFAAVILGCVASAMLALVLDGLTKTLELGLRKGRRALVWVSVATMAVLYAYSGFAYVLERAAAPAVVLRVGSKPFTEQYILSEVLSEHLRKGSDVEVHTLPSLGSTVIFDALRTGQIDAYVDYVGTLWTTVFRRTDPPRDRAHALEYVKNNLWTRYGIRLVAALGFENAYVLAARQRLANDMGVRTLSQLGAVSSRLAIGGDFEFFARPEWKALKQTYGLSFREERTMDPSLMYPAIQHAQVDVIGAYTTDGRLSALRLDVLDDDRAVIPPYDAVVLVSRRVVEQAPHLVTALQKLEGRIDASQMRRMNDAVDRLGKSPKSVARQFVFTYKH